MVQRAARFDRRAVPVRFGLRLLAQAVFLITAFAAFGALREHVWPLGGLGAFVIASVLSFLAVLIHELAHAGVARWLGADILKIVVLPFEWRLRPRRLRFVGTVGHGDIGGYVAYHLDRIGAARKHAVIAVAGPLANIVAAVAAGFAAAMLDTGKQAVVVATLASANINSPAFPDNEAISAWLANTSTYVDYGEPVGPVLAAAFMLVSLGMGLGNLIPFDQSDGMHLWRYFRRRAR